MGRGGEGGRGTEKGVIEGIEEGNLLSVSVIVIVAVLPAAGMLAGPPAPGDNTSWNVSIIVDSTTSSSSS